MTTVGSVGTQFGWSSATIVSEPGIALLFALGLIGILVSRRRQPQLAGMSLDR